MSIKSIFFNKKFSAKNLWILVWSPWLLIFCAYCVSLLNYPYEWEPGEGARILYAQRFLQGEPIYSSNQEFPMLGNCYPPVYFLLTALVMKTGIDPLIGGRLISIISIILIIFGIYSVVEKLTGSKKMGLIAGACFVFPSPVANWYPLARMDSLCGLLLFGLAYLVFRKPDSVKASFFSGAIAVAALYTKQTALFVVGSMMLFYLLGKKWKQFFVYCSTVLFLGLLFFLLCQHWTDGWFYKNLFSENIDRVFIARRYGIFFGWIFKSAPVVCVLAVITVVCKIFSREYRVWILFFWGGLANALLIGANGSGMNYFVCLWSVVSILFVLCLYNIEKMIRSDVVREVVSVVILLAVSVSFFNGIGFSYEDTLLDYIPKKSDLYAMKCLDGHIKRSEGDIFVDRFPYISMKYDKNQFYMEPALIQELHHAGKWSPDELLRKINAREFSMVFLLSESLLPSILKRAIKKNYLLSEYINIGTFEIGRTRKVLVYRNE